MYAFCFQKFEKKYQRELSETEKVAPQTQFEYAWCLVRSDFPSDIKKVQFVGVWLCIAIWKVGIEILIAKNVGFHRQGILLLEELMQTHSEGNRDYIYYLAIGNARIKEYTVAMKFCKAFLQIEPNNQQAITLEVSFIFIVIIIQKLWKT